MIRVNIRPLLEFFDEAPDDSQGHATALTQVAGEDLGLALLVHALGRLEGAEARVLGRRCTQGTKSGRRLDGWVLANWGSGDHLLQVEVKSWSAHAIGGKRLPLSATKKDLREHRINRWDRVWKGDGFRGEGSGKVLIPMKPPREHRTLPVTPALSLWFNLHPDGKDAPIFPVRLRGSKFDKLIVFSQSAYLRLLLKQGKRSLRLDMPDTARRLGWLDEIYKVV
jgi:hypothetical protein